MAKVWRCSKANCGTQVKDQKVVQKMQQKITTDVKVTPRDVRKFYDAHSQR